MPNQHPLFHLPPPVDHSDSIRKRSGTAAAIPSQFFAEKSFPAFHHFSSQNRSHDMTARSFLHPTPSAKQTTRHRLNQYIDRRQQWWDGHKYQSKVGRRTGPLLPFVWQKEKAAHVGATCAKDDPATPVLPASMHATIPKRRYKGGAAGYTGRYSRGRPSMPRFGGW